MSNEQQNKELAKQEPSMSERFTQMVIKEFGGSVGEVALTEFQKRLAQNYFMHIDTALNAAEDKRKKKKKENQDPVPVTWANVNLELLARNVVSNARLGLDPAIPNHISAMPFKNNNLAKYDIVFIHGYRGIELKATKYGLDVPDAVIVELVYSNDHFKEIKKDRNNPYASYEFEVVNAFDRGEIIGGFYYHLFNEHPEKNKLVVMSIKDILKRKPQYASVEFWGGEKDKWEYDEKTGKNKKVGTEHVDGWFDKMCYKTVYRAAYNDITLDSQKIDEDYLRLKQMELALAEARAETEITENANKDAIDIEFQVKPETENETGEPPITESPGKSTEPPQDGNLGPGF